MLYVVKSLFHRPAIRMGRVDNTLIRTTRLRNAQFVSFMSQTESIAPFSSDRYESRMRRRKIVKLALFVAGIAGVAWVIVESARAMTMF
ncbi:MAG: hypothetical protein QM790_13890 [Nibricoccus sp.]